MAVVTRRALLISNPGESGAENYCKGVYADMRNYDRFLNDAHGGWWFSNEIVTRDRPSKDEVRRLVKELSVADYLFIAFAGHGWFSSKDNATVLTLRKGEELSSLELLVGRAKRTLILDCCREIYNDSALEESVEQRKMALARAEVKRMPVGRLCRSLFDEGIVKAGDEPIILHSSMPAEKSGDDELVGGHYTSSVIGSADEWAGEVAENPLINNVAMSVVLAHDAAAPVTTRRRGGKQHPYIEKSKSGPYLPFSVFAA